jgi:cell division septum initiation protein DivIVA
MLNRFEVWKKRKTQPALEQTQLETQVKDGQQRLARLGKAIQQAEDSHNERRRGVSTFAFSETAIVVYELREVQHKRYPEAYTR